MSRRVELDSALPPIALPSRVLNEICAHALETLPEECCGLVAGDGRRRHRDTFPCRNDMARQHRIDPARFPRSGREAFYMHPLDYLRAVEEAERRGCRITAVYHSHVGFGAYLSELDLEFAEQETFPFPDADHIVVGVVEGRVREIALFEPDAPGRFGAGRSVVPEHA